MTEKSSSQILLSSTLATTLVAALTNPLDVLKVRIQNTTRGCNIPKHKHKRCVHHAHAQPLSSALRKASLYNLVMTPNLVDHYKVLCDCLPFRSNTKALIYLTRKEGIRTLGNGLRQGMMVSIMTTVSYFYFYETAKKMIQKHTNHEIALPLLAALSSRGITTCFAFPFEYWKTLQQSVVGVNVKTGFKLGTNINSGLPVLLQRDLLFSAFYWVLVENIRKRVMTFFESNDGGYTDKTSLFVSNLIAGGVSGGISSLITLPLDVLKTRKQLHPREYGKMSTVNMLREIYKKEGIEALYAGTRQRVTKSTMSCAGVLTLYELFSDLFKENSK